MRNVYQISCDKTKLLFFDEGASPTWEGASPTWEGGCFYSAGGAGGGGGGGGGGVGGGGVPR